MYSSNVSFTSFIKDEPTGIASKFKLGQNYPNPFNPTTTIEYTISESSPVTIKIYNIQGKEIASLVNSDHSAGNYSVNWNGQDRFGRPAASGTYIYQIVAGEHRESKQMILMR
jgi:flagellar hook assembly protein FlgD